MPGFYDIVYGGGLLLGAPAWLARGKSRRKALSALRERMGDVPVRTGDEPAVMIHAVSLGEMNATRSLIEKLREVRPGLDFIISTTTNTGFAQARKLYGNSTDTTIIRYPLDFTRAIKRVLDRLRPSAVILMELEVWPNFLKHCERREIPVLVINARLTTSSYRNYRLGGLFSWRMFRRISRVCAQDELYARRFVSVGVPPQRVSVTGTMKFDTAQVEDRIDGDAELARVVGLKPGQEKIWVCGSTGPGEEEVVLEAYRSLIERFADLRLAIVPRHPERFEQVAELIAGAGFDVVRRSGGRCGEPHPTNHVGQCIGWALPTLIAGSLHNAVGDAHPMKPAVILGDTMGELRKFYSLADMVFVGRTLVDLGPRQHGSDMIEPAALGKPVVIGPYTRNFADAMNRFRQGRAIVEIPAGREPRAHDLHEAITELLARPEEARAMGERARQIVKQNQGATQRHVQIIFQTLNERTRIEVAGRPVSHLSQK